jgi:hypothetical protein
MRLSLVDYPAYFHKWNNLDFHGPESVLGSELVVFDVESSYKYYRARAPREYRNLPSLGDSVTAQFAADFARRSKEFREVLSTGGTLALMVPPPLKAYLDTGRRTYSGTGRNRHETIIVDEFDFLRVLPVRLETAVAQGQQISFGSDEFGSILRTIEADLEYRAVIESAVSTVIGTIAGAVSPVCAMVRTEGLSGRMLLLPHVLSRSEYKSEKEWLRACARFLDAIISLHKRYVGESDPAPAWIEQYRTVPEIKMHRALGELQERFDAISEEMLGVRASIDEVRAKKVLLYGTGRELEIAVAQALAAMGVAVQEGDAARTDLILSWKGKTAVAEVKGLTKSAGETSAVQAEKWVSEYHATKGVEPKGILIINTFRGKPLAQRGNSFPAQMLTYVKRKELALVTTQQLFNALESVGSAPAEVERFLDALFETVGVVELFREWNNVLSVASSDSEQTVDPSQVT